MDARGSAVRMGGDEFAILCDGIGGSDEAVALGKEIQAIFATPFDVSPLGVRLTSACGFALFPTSAAEAGELVRLADTALYRAKADGPGGAAVFDARAEQTAISVAVFEDAFRRAVGEEDRAVPVPPILDFATGTAPLNRLRA
jgi:predicted signal transduction protein with EAL and GGDEF domain